MLRAHLSVEAVFVESVLDSLVLVDSLLLGFAASVSIVVWRA